MPKSKQRKDHKKKLKQRSEKLSREKKAMEKIQKDYFMKLIEEEKKKGMFNNLPTINPDGNDLLIDGPSL